MWCVRRLILTCVALAAVCQGAKWTSGSASFTNEGPFGRMSDDQWRAMQFASGYRKSWKPPSPTASSIELSFTLSEISTALQASVDWHHKFTDGNRVMTRVKNQGACGACYIFSILAVLEALYANKTGVLKSLSEQAVLDCVSSSSGSGCSGGDPYLLALSLLNFKPPLEAEYPYSWSTFNSATVGTQSACGTTGVASPSSVYTLNMPAEGTHEERENIMAAYVFKYGPLQASIDSTSSAFKNYASGILSIPNSGNVTLTHAVAIVGYGVDQGLAYWKVKNSWGPQWGEGGYFRILRGEGLCGIDKDVVGIGF